MPLDRKLSIALLVIRLGVGAFLAMWTSLKFFRPEWMVNVFTNVYHLEWVTAQYAYFVGSLQALLVLAFVLGAYRTITYGFVTLMHATGVVGTLFGGQLLNFTNYPNNLLWTSVSTLAALIALFLLRQHDNYTVDGWRGRRAFDRHSDRIE